MDAKKTNYLQNGLQKEGWRKETNLDGSYTEVLLCRNSAVGQ